ncbi:MAG TPA: non-ribosomal peptide synthase/polyketide synthase [Thermoanaerobaculia bacterium]|nr:non-ribosomal peptide synthase/polyketide synthase [Thermoanaerobaculia bacterium]
MDRKVLARIEPAATAMAGEAPRTPLEATLAGIFAGVLGLERAGIHDDFFALGGHSLLAIRLVSHLHRAFEVDLPVSAVFQAPTVAALAGKLAVMPTAAGAPALEPVPRDEPLPLSFAQQRLWFLDRLAAGGSAYNLPAAALLEGHLDERALEGSLGEILRRHEALRTVFAEADGRPVQTVRPPVPAALARLDLSGLPEPQRLPEAREAAAREAVRPFDLAAGPVVRFLLIRLSGLRHLLVATFHHIAADGWSLQVFLRELSALYGAFAAGLPSPLPELPVQYADYAVWQRRALSGAALARPLAFWRSCLAGVEPLELPGDGVRLATGSALARTVRLDLPPALVAAVADCAREAKVTPFLVLLAAFYALLSRLTGETDLTVGTPVAARDRTEVEGLIGFFANTLPLRTDLAGDPSFRESLARVREVVLAAHNHAEVPFERLVEELRPERAAGRSPFFGVMLSYLSAPPDRMEIPGLALVPLDLPPSEAKLDLTWTIQEREGGWAGTLEGRGDLFEESTLEGLAGHLRVLLEGALSDAGRRLSEIPLLSASQRLRILGEWSGTVAAEAHRGSFHELFAEQVRRTPDAPALVWGDAVLTFGELDRRANRLAHHLLALGAGPETRTAILLDRSPEAVVAILGVLKAGGSYVPLDLSQPRERIEHMLADTGALLLLTRSGLPPAGEGFGPRRLCLDLAAAAVAARPDTDPAVSVEPESLAYVIYTSGSTGLPKGVAVPHRAVVSFAAALRRAVPELRQGSPLRLSLNASLHFDASVQQLGCLLDGHALRLVPEEARRDAGRLAAFLREATLDGFDCTPSQLEILLSAAAASGAPPRFVLSGGEAIPTALWERLAADARTRFYNVYGPTEATIDTTLWPVEGSRPVLGRPLPGSRVHLLDPWMQPVPVGARGEIWIGGSGLARGYWRRPDLTAERFVPDPFGEDPGGRLYRTGDLGRWLGDGRIEYLGRTDQQVKIRGFRVEPGEIESCLRRHPDVESAAVVAHRDASGAVHLAACFVPRAPVQAAALRDHLRQSLPEPMVPARFVQLDTLPLTPSGKLDRRALERLELPAEARDGGAAPRTPVQELLAGIWSELLGAPRIGLDDSFFDLGGHSLLATRLMSRISLTFGVDLPVSALFEAPTVSALAEKICAAVGATAPPIVRVPRDSDLPLSFAQQRLWFLHQLEPDSSAYHIPVPVRMTGGLRPAVLAASLDAVVARHEALRTTFEPGDAGPVQRISASHRQELPLIDLEGLPPEARETEAHRLSREEAERPFDLRRGPLLRSLLLRLDGQEHLLLLVQHHIVSDGWSMGVLVQELSDLYRAFGEGRPSPLPELPVQYADFAVWQRQWLQGAVLEREQAWWRGELSGCPQVLELPVDRPRPPVLSGNGERVRLDLPVELSRELADLSRRLGATLFMTLLASFQAVLARWSGQEELLTGTPIANRNRVEIEGLIGFFVNTLALRGRVEGHASFAELVRRVRERTLAAYAHQDLPFEALVEELQPERDPSRSPLFQVMLTLQNAPLGRPELPGVRLGIPTAGIRSAKFDLSLALAEEEGALRGSLTYSADLFDRATMARLAGHFHALLEAVAGDAQRPVGEIALCSPAELHQVRAEWNDTRAAAPELRGFHQLFAEQARRTPEAMAVVAEDGLLTYRELDQGSSRLAHRLLELGAGRGRPVALSLERSTGFVACILAAHKAGAPYLPLDPAFPAERVESILADAGPVVLVTRTPRLAQLGAANAALCLDLEEEKLGSLPQEPPAIAVEPEDLAYVIYTSGSTGRPKGVAVEHRHLTSYLRGALERLRPPSGASWGVVSTLAADLGHTCLFPALATGGCLHVVSPDCAADPEAFADYCRCHPLDVLKIVPSHLVALESAQGAAVLPRLRLVLGGEAFDRSLAERLCAAVPAGCRVFNHYGPTETTVGVAACPVEGPFRSATVPLGRPLADTRAYVADAGQRLLPIGVPGELLLGGDHVARGYFRRPDLTAERFIPDPFGAWGERLYRTGDRVRLLADGRLEFLGRIDRQVKIRGFRVELGEIEAVLAQHPAVRAAVVEARPDRRGERRLVAWFVAEGVPASALEAFLVRRLPRPMIPAAFVRLESLPLTANGKIDRRALPEPEAAAGVSSAEPLTPMEEVIAAIWADLLGLDRVGKAESFFELGGHSLLATRAVSRLRAALGVEVPLRALFEAPTAAALARRIGAAGPAEGEPIRPRQREGVLPLSFGQQRLWFLDRLEPGSSVYNMPATLRLRGRLDRTALETALGEIVRRHEVLRTVFPEIEGGPVQVVLPPRGVELPVVDLGGLESPEPELERLGLESARRPFDLARGPMLRASLLRLGEEHHALLLALHHIAGDGWSVGLFLRELGQLYGNFAADPARERVKLPELPVQYGDFAAWQREHLSGKVLSEQIGYWRQRLAGLPVLALSADRPRPSAPSHRGAQERFALPAVLTRGLEALSRREGATPFMTLLAAFGVLLSRYSGQEDFAVGSPVAGRSQAETESLIGFFVNTLVLRCDLAGDPTLGALLARVRETCLEAYAHQDAPFDRLVEELRPERDLSRSPLFQVMLAFQDEARVVSLPGLQTELLPLDGGVARFDLTLSLTRSEAGLAGVAELATDLFDRATIRRLFRHFRVLLEGAVAGADRRLSELPLLEEAELRQILCDWNRTERPWPREATLHGLFAAQAARTPGAVALVAREERLTYAELRRRADRVADALRALGVGPEVRVAICTERSLDLVVAVLGVLAAGGAYVPLDPRYPVARLELMLEDCAAPVLLTQASLRSLLPAVPGARVLLLDGDLPQPVVPQGAAQAAPAGPGNAAYVIYTSGSTGRPKGVEIEHRSAAALVAWALETFPAGSLDGMLFSTSVCFDLSVFELFVPLSSGGKVILAASALDLPELPGAGEVTFVNTVPSAMVELVQSEAVPASVRVVGLAGEPLRASLVESLEGLGTVEAVFNLYGPTEDTTYSTWARVDHQGRAETWTPPIGRPVSNSRVYVLDRRLQPVPAGVPGELYLGGAGLARGYLGRPEATAERFVPDPFEDGGYGERLYRTGDLVRWRSDGELEFLGRLDHQVKVRGFRIELGEIEAVLSARPGVHEAAVLVHDGAPAGPRLVAYVEGEAAAGELRRALEERLPSYIVPSAFVVLESFPRTPNGKVDRRALRTAAGELPQATRESEAPRTPVEEVIATIWADLLGLDRVGATESFFALGGHSLLATRAVARLRTALGVELPLRALFEAPTVAELAARIEALRAPGRELAPLIVPTSRDRDLPLSFAQERLWLLDQLEPGSAVYNIPAAVALRGTLQAGALAAAMGEVVRRHEALRTTFTAVGGASCQRIASPAPVPLPRIDLTALPEPRRRAETARLAAEEAARPFDLAAGPLLRARLLRLAGDEHLALLTLHHIVSDGWSTGVLVSELAALYGAFAQGLPSPLPEPALQYADFVAWQREWLCGGTLDSEMAWWREQLAGAPEVLELPADRPRPPVQSLRGAKLAFSIDPGLTRRLYALTRRQGATLFTTLLAVFQVLLLRYTGQTDFLVGAPVAGRTRSELEGLIGLFVNTLVLRARAEGDPSFADLLARARETALDAFEHQDLPFDKLVAELRPERSLSRAPLVQVALALQNAPSPPLVLPWLSLEPVAVESGTSRFDLTLVLAEEGGGISGVVEHSTDLFDRETIERLAGHFANLLASAAARPEPRLSELEMLSEPELRQVLAGWNDTATPYPREATVHGRFAEQARRAPAAPAVEMGGESLSYGELARRAGRLARRLRRLGVGPESRVGFCLERTPDVATAMLGILEAGAAYVPLDLAYPWERLAFMVEDAGIAALVTLEHLLPLLPVDAEGRGLRVVCLDVEEDGEEAEGAGASDLGADAIAYVMYTSGSTGRPKGVAVTHRGIVRLVVGTDYVDFGPADRVLQASTTVFDAATYEIWGALLNGACLVGIEREVVLAPPRLAAELRRQRITATLLTTALFHQVAREVPDAFAPLRHVVFGGEACDPDRLRQVLAAGPPACLVNAYGPTEGAVITTVHAVTAVGAGAVSVPIGRPIANTRAYLLDRHLRPVPAGVPGELLAGGDGLSRGYLGRPDLTAERFVPDACSGEAGARLYRTGDLARYLPDGAIEFLGRIDQQIKIRGFRIEPGEVEASLSAHPAVAQCAVVAHRAAAGLRLVAYVVAAEEGLTAEALRASLRASLPEHMVPSLLLFLPALPLSPNGKVDRRALPAPEAGSLGRREPVPPRNAVEELLAEIWRRLLEIERVGVHDGFFELGGHSLLAFQLITEIQDVLGVSLSLRAAFETPTLEALAERVAGEIERLAGEELLAQAWGERAETDVPAVLPPQGGKA